MNRKANKFVFPVAPVVLMVTFLAAIFFASANLSFAASGKKKTAEVARISAVDHAEARIKELQGALKITEEQKVVWNNLTQVMRDNAKEMDALTKERSENRKTMNAVEYMKFHSQITKAQLDQLEKVIPPFEAFYASMSNEQMKITDTIFRTGRHDKKKRK